MEGNGSMFGAIIGMIIVAALFTLLGIDIHKDLTVIDTRVETDDGHVYDCTEAHAHDNGMTYVRNPHYIQIPTRSIKIIKKIQ